MQRRGRGADMRGRCLAGQGAHQHDPPVSLGANLYTWAGKVKLRTLVIIRTVRGILAVRLLAAVSAARRHAQQPHCVNQWSSSVDSSGQAKVPVCS